MALKFKDFEKRMLGDFSFSFKFDGENAEIRFLHLKSGKSLSCQLIMNSEILEWASSGNFGEIPLDTNIYHVRGDILPIQGSWQLSDALAYLKEHINAYPLYDAGGPMNKLGYLMNLLRQEEDLYILERMENGLVEAVNVGTGEVLHWHC